MAAKIQRLSFWFSCQRLLVRWAIAQRRDMTWLTLARHAPRSLVYWSLLHAGSCTMQGDEDVASVAFMEIVGRWEKRCGR